MGDDNGRAILADHIERALDGSLGLVVDRAGGFVQNQYGWVFQNGARQCQTLALAAGQFLAPFANAGGKTQRQFVNELRALGGACRLCNLFVAGTGCAIGNVFRHRAVSQKRVLRHIADGTAQVLQIQAINGLTVEQNAPALRGVKA